MDFYEQRAAAIQDELITTEARGYISRVIAGSSKEPHSHESFVMILAALPPLKLKLFLDDAAGRDLICKPRRMFHCEKERKEQAHPAVQLASLALRPRELPMRSRSPLFGFTPFPNGSSALRLGMLPCTVMDVVPRGKTGVTRGHLALT